MKFLKNDFNENSWIADWVSMGLTSTVTYHIWHDHHSVRSHIFAILAKKLKIKIKKKKKKLWKRREEKGL